MNKIIFKKWINSIKNRQLNNWLTNFFVFKNLLIRICSFSLILIICNILFFVLRDNALNDMYGTPIFNKGASLGLGQDWPTWTIYFLKIVIASIFLIFSLIFNKWYIYIPLFIIGINSWLNNIDKFIVDVYDNEFYYNTVVDYFYWNLGFTNNIADTLIVIFVVVLVISLIFELIRNFKKEENEEKNEKDI